MLAGEETEVSVLGFSNDLDSFQNKDEVITALVHLGYLTYSGGRVRIPNREIVEEFANSVFRQKNYAREVLQAADRVLLVGINYDKESKKHQCVIEEL